MIIRPNLCSRTSVTLVSQLRNTCRINLQTYHPIAGQANGFDRVGTKISRIVAIKILDRNTFSTNQNHRPLQHQGRLTIQSSPRLVSTIGCDHSSGSSQVTTPYSLLTSTRSSVLVPALLLQDVGLLNRSKTQTLRLIPCRTTCNKNNIRTG